MQKLIIFFLLLTSLKAQALVIVSDFDDTIKITNAGNLAAATYNGFLMSKVYTGMPELLAEMRSYAPELHIVSAAPSIVAPRIRSLLRKQGVRYDSLRYRLLRNWKDKILFKTQVIEAVIAEGEEVILLGDDVEKDPEIFSEIGIRFPGKVLASYVHSIRNRKLPAGVTPYFTSFDLALNEFMAGRLSSSSVEVVLSSLLTAPDLKRAFPGFAHCPTGEEDFSWQRKSELGDLGTSLTEKIIDFCSLREKSATVKN